MGERRAPVIVGLLVAWGGSALLVSPAARFLDETSLGRAVGQAVLWLLCAAVVGTVLVWERKPLSSLWLRRFEWQSAVWAAALVLGNIFIVFPSTEWVRRAVALPGYAAGMEYALASPLPLRVFTVITAGIVEEILFRGYAVTRLLQLSGSLVLSVIAASVIFAALHLPVWGPGPSLAFLIGGLATTAFFAWRRDLVTMIIAHIANDMWGLVVAPGLSEWWA